MIQNRKLVHRKGDPNELNDLIDGKSSLVLVRDHQATGDFGQETPRFNKLVVSLIQGENSTDEELFW